MPPRRLSASWVLPVTRPPIRDGAVLVGDDGRVAVVGPELDVPSPPGVPSEHFVGGLLLPGLVNAHTHLELTGLAGLIEESHFPDWLQRIRALKRERSTAEYLDAARQGLRTCWAGGVTTVADTGDSGAVARVLAEAGGSGIAYVEVFGPDPAQHDESLASLEARLAELAPCAGPRVRIGVSPHAPYTVSGPLFRSVARLAERASLPLATHLAESPAESALIARSEGPFADGWRRRDIPLPDTLTQLPDPLPVRTPVRWLDAHGVLGPGTLCIHVVQVDAGDAAVLARREVGIAHCPRSNARHGHGDAPLGLLLEAGLRVGLGTDSEVSVGRLDLFAEAREARRLGALTAEQALRMMSLDAALAIGVPDVGLLEEGAWGDVCLLRGQVPVTDPLRIVLDAAPDDVELTVLHGSVVWRRTTA
jgi:cytosine/adenosine deaminase-related metal-dependent hydrolase